MAISLVMQTNGIVVFKPEHFYAEKKQQQTQHNNKQDKKAPII
jgi:hypothetical protein